MELQECEFAIYKNRRKRGVYQLPAQCFVCFGLSFSRSPTSFYSSEPKICGSECGLKYWHSTPNWPGGWHCPGEPQEIGLSFTQIKNIPFGEVGF